METETLNSLLLIVQVMLSISVIVLILIQHGKGADAGAAFGGGGGASGSVFGAKGSGNFLSKTTGILATLFFITCMALAYLSSHRDLPDGITGSVMTEQSGETQQNGDLPLAIEADSLPQSDLPPVE